MRKILALILFVTFALPALGQVIELPPGVEVAKDQSADPKPPKTAITRADLEKRLEDLKQAQAQALANLQAVGGAIQDCEYFLNLLEKPKPELPKVEPANKPARSEPKP